MEKELKILAGSIVIESDFSKSAKKQLINFLETANIYQVKAFLMDGEIVGNLDDNSKSIIDSRFDFRNDLQQEGTLRSIMGMMILNPVGWAAYRVIRAAIDSKSARCGALAIGFKRDHCMLMVKKLDAQKTINLLRSQAKNCEQTKNPSKCKAQVNKGISKLQKKIADIDSRSRKMGAKGKNVGAAEARAKQTDSMMPGIS